MHLPRRRRLAAGLAVAALTGAALVAAPAAAATSSAEADADGAPAASLRAAVASGDLAAGALPRGETRRGAVRLSAKGSMTTAPAPAPAPTSEALSTATVSTINVTFVDTADSAWTSPAKAAFRSAADVWERTVESRVPIEVEATARSLGPGLLGGAGPFDFLRNEGATVVPDGRAATAAELRDDVFEPVALYNARTGRDALPPEGGRRNPDIVAEFNPDLSGLYFGTDGRPPGDLVDFRTVVLHEIGHGLGIAGTASVDGDWASLGSTAINGTTGVRSGVSFDQFTYATTAREAGTGGARVLSLADGSTALRQALTGGQLYWAGQQALTAARGAKVRLYAPASCGEPGPPRPCVEGESSFVQGTSYSHLDESVYPRTSAHALMTPYLDTGEAYAGPGQIAMGVLADMGYAVPALSGTRFTALEPARVLDTRSGLGAPARTLGPGGAIDLPVRGLPGVPAGATAVVLNVTGVRASAATDVRVYPTPVTALPLPVVSSLNLAAGRTRANLVTVPIGAAGRVRLRNSSGSLHLLADLAGYYAPGAASAFTPTDPVRLLDTRKAIGTPSRTRVPAGGTVDLQVAGAGSVPAGAAAVALTVTAVSASAPTDVRVYPGGGAPGTVPRVSNVNAGPGVAVPNLVVVGLGGDGSVRLRNAAGEVHLLADLAGYYAKDGSLFRAVTPQRILDTRRGLGTAAGTPSRLGPGQSTTLSVGGAASLPLRSTAVALNVTGVAASTTTDVRVYPATALMPPVVSNLNLSTGMTAAGLVVVKTGGGGVKLRNAAGSVALVADAAGWFGPAT